MLTLFLLAAIVYASECGEGIPCRDGRCCSQHGFCGTTAEFCAPSKLCVSNCWKSDDFESFSASRGVNSGIVLECGYNLPCQNGCCSAFGWCGFGDQFCGLGCQNNCLAVPQIPVPVPPPPVDPPINPPVEPVPPVVLPPVNPPTPEIKVPLPSNFISQFDVDFPEDPWFDQRGLYSSCPIKGSFALTFDDGPDILTGAILDILALNGIKATFFVTARSIAGNEFVLKRAFDEGHQIAAHSYSHADYTTMSRDEIIEDMNATSAAILNVIGRSVKFFRPPFGAYSDLVIDTVTGLGYKIILWNLDSVDFEVTNFGGSANDVYTKFYQPIQRWPNTSEKGWIALQHDQNQVSVDALQDVINLVRARGFVFRTINECFSDSSYF